MNQIKTEARVFNFQPLVLIVLAFSLIYMLLIRFQIIPANYPNIDLIGMLSLMLPFFYLVMWFIWIISPWDAIINEQGIVRIIKAGGYSQTINTSAYYSWQEAKSYSIKENKIRIYFNKYSILNMLFYLDIYCNKTQKSIIENVLIKNKISIN